MKGGVDKGFCFSYWKLSYRRKFLRTLWFGLLVIPVALFMDVPFLGRVEEGILLLIAIGTFVAQAIYTYVSWQNEKRET